MRQEESACEGQLPRVYAEEEQRLRWTLIAQTLLRASKAVVQQKPWATALSHAAPSGENT